MLVSSCIILCGAVTHYARGTFSVHTDTIRCLHDLLVHGIVELVARSYTNHTLTSCNLRTEIVI